VDPATLVEEVVPVAGRDLRLLRPRDAEALLDEEAFEHEEYLPYWAELWPSAVALARTVGVRALRGAATLELGCGLGLPSIVAARGGADVLATDSNTDAVAFAAHGLALNELEATVARADWTSDGDALVERGPFDLVLAADVLYTTANADEAVRLLPRLVEPNGQVWLADPDRAGGRRFLAGARKSFYVQTREHDEVRLHTLRPR
jgi:predicted nicotinamide N-methyase